MRDPTVFLPMEASFVDTPQGIFTASGTWFRTTEALLEEFAGPVLEREGIDRLTSMADRWLRSPATITIWLLPVLLWQLGVLPSLAIALGLYFLLAIWGPLFIGYWVDPILRGLDYIALQALWYILALSFFALLDRFDLLAAGLTFFVMMRWGLVKKITDPLTLRVHQKLYSIPYPDQMLRSVVVRSAMKHGFTLPELEKMERSILERLHRK